MTPLVFVAYGCDAAVVVDEVSILQDTVVDVYNVVVVVVVAVPDCQHLVRILRISLENFSPLGFVTTVCDVLDLLEK